MTTTKIRTSSQVIVDADFDANSKKITNLATPTANTDAATKLYVDGILAAGDAMQYKGVIDCSSDPNYPAASAGDTYKVSVGGKIGGASGVSVLAGDMFVCTSDGTIAGTQAAVGASWNVIHTNAASGSVTSSSSSVTDNSIVRMDSTTGTIVQTSLVTIDDNGSINVPSGQSFKVNGTALATNANHSGDVSGDTTLTIGANKVTLGMQATLPTMTIIGNDTGGSLTPKALTATEVRALLNVANGATAVTLPTFVTREAVSGTKNGTNPTFTLANTPTSGSEMIFLNGILLNSGAGNDYTISTNTLTMLTTAIPVSTDILLASYRY